jgi:hypothetical protein
MKKNLLVIAFSLLSFLAAAQVRFDKEYPIWNEMSMNNFKQTSDGGYIFSTDAIPEMDTVSQLGQGYLIKTNSYGTTSWIKKYPKTNFFIKEYDGCSVDQTTDNGYIIGCDYYTNSSNSGCDYIYLIRTDASGNFSWANTYPGLGTSTCWCVKETDDLGYIACGGTTDTVAHLDYGYLLKTDIAGNVQWAKTYSEIANTAGAPIYTVEETSDGGYIMCGKGAVDGAFVIKTDSLGNISWYKNLSTATGEALYSVRQTADGGYIATGNTAVGSVTRTDLLRLDSAGTILWMKYYTTAGSVQSRGYSVRETNAGDFVVSGSELTNGNNHSNALLKTDLFGNVLWQKEYTDSYSVVPSYLEKTTDGGFAFPTFFMEPSVPFWHVLMIKTDSMGIIPCNSVSLAATDNTLTPVLRSGFAVGTGYSQVNMPTTFTTILVHDSLLCGLHEGIADQPDQQGIFNVFPDPSNGNFTFQLLAAQNNAFTITIYNQLGQPVFIDREKNAGEFFTKQIDLSAFADGIYFISVQAEHGPAYGKKILKTGN